MAAIDDLQNFSSQLGGRAGMLDPMFGDLSGLSGAASGAYKTFLDNQNLATGLSPEALSAFRTQQTSGINDQYQSAAQAMNSQLLRRGATGGGALPGSGGDISRAYQPLYSAMEAAKTKSQRDTILADEEAKARSLYQNQQLAMNAANNVYGQANTLFNSGNNAILGAAGIADKAADLEGVNWGELLGTTAISGLLNPSQAGGGLSGLISGGGTNGSGRFGVLGDLLGGLWPGGGGGDGEYTREAIQRPGGGGPLSLSGGGPVNKLVTAGVENLPKVGAGIGEALGTVGAGLGSAAGAIGNAATAAGSAIGSGLSSLASAAVPLLTNPITAVAGAAILGAVAWTKSQAHWEANTWTKGFQKPFDDQMGDAVNQVQQLKASGQYTPETAQQMQSTAQQAIDGYLQQLDKFYREKGTNSDQAKVASQAWATFQKYYGPGGSYYIDSLKA